MEGETLFNTSIFGDSVNLPFRIVKYPETGADGEEIGVVKSFLGDVELHALPLTDGLEYAKSALFFGFAIKFSAELTEFLSEDGEYVVDTVDDLEVKAGERDDDMKRLTADLERERASREQAEYKYMQLMEGKLIEFASSIKQSENTNKSEI